MASKPPETKKKKRSFRQELLKDFSWLEFRNEGMRCTLYSKHKMNIFTTEGCKDFQYLSVIRHQSSDGHQHSLKASKQASCLQMGFKSMATKSEESVVPQLRTVMKSKTITIYNTYIGFKFITLLWDSIFFRGDPIF